MIAFGGLSPLARGTRTLGAASGQLERFIPAGAGNTLVKTRQAIKLAVYPRWRGEHALADQLGVSYSGLSPLARGTH